MNEQRALIAAMELLRVAIQNNTTATTQSAANTQRDEVSFGHQVKTIAKQIYDGAASQAHSSDSTLPDQIQAVPQDGAMLAEVKAIRLAVERLAGGSSESLPRTQTQTRNLTSSEKKFQEFRNDPERRDRNAAKKLEDAKEREARELRSPAGKAIGQIGKNFAGKMAGSGAISGVVGKMGPIGLAASPILSVLEKVVGKFAELLSPMAILSQAMESPIAGFQLIGKATKLLAGVLAPVFLPITLLVAGGLAVVANILFTELQPVMDDWFDLILNDGIPVIQELIDEFKDSIQAIKDFYNALPDRRSKDRKERITAYAGQYGAALSLGPLAPLAVTGLLYRDVLGGGGITEAAKKKQAERKKTRKRGEGLELDLSLSEMLESLKKSIGPQASMGSLGSVGHQVQLAALNQDPLEARLMKMQLEQLKKIEAALKRQRDKRRVYDPRTGDGDFSGDIGAGGGGDYGGSGDF